MTKHCPVCDKPYTESQLRKTRGGYRAFRHFESGKVWWCKTWRPVAMFVVHTNPSNLPPPAEDRRKA